jgi:hypothetical protein
MLVIAAATLLLLQCATVSPPATDSTAALRHLQETAESNDFAAFQSALAAARSVNAPAGVMNVYADLEKVWRAGGGETTLEKRGELAAEARKQLEAAGIEVAMPVVMPRATR